MYANILSLMEDYNCLMYALIRQMKEFEVFFFYHFEILSFLLCEYIHFLLKWILLNLEWVLYSSFKFKIKKCFLLVKQKNINSF